MEAIKSVLRKSLILVTSSQMQKVNFKIFSPNESENALSSAMDLFLRRQVLLEANCTVFLNMKNDVELVFAHMFIDSSNESVFAGQTYETHPDHNHTHKELKDYFYLWQLVQSVENFESFLKTVVSFVETAQNTSTSDSLRTSKDRVGYLKKGNQQIAGYLSTGRYKEVYETFLLSELVRQITVHSNMIITERIKPKLDSTSKLFKRYFGTSLSGGREQIHPLNVGSVQQLMIKISELAYMLFKAVCSKYNLPIIEATFYLGEN